MPDVMAVPLVVPSPKRTRSNSKYAGLKIEELGQPAGFGLCLRIPRCLSLGTLFGHATAKFVVFHVFGVPFIGTPLFSREGNPTVRSSILGHTDLVVNPPASEVMTGACISILIGHEGEISKVRMKRIDATVRENESGGPRDF